MLSICTYFLINYTMTNEIKKTLIAIRGISIRALNWIPDTMRIILSKITTWIKYTPKTKSDILVDQNKKARTILLI